MKRFAINDGPGAGKTTVARMPLDALHWERQRALPEEMPRTTARRAQRYACGHPEAVARQLATHLTAIYGITSTVAARYGIAMVRLGDLCVWIRLGEISWSTGDHHPHGRPIIATIPASQTAQAAEQIAVRYQQIYGACTVRIG